MAGRGNRRHDLGWSGRTGRSGSPGDSSRCVALIGLLIGGLVVGGWLRPQPAPDAVLPSTTAIPSPSAEASSLPAGQGLVAYTEIEALEPGVDCTDSFVSVSCFRPRLWVSNADGSDAHELFPNRPGRQTAVAWSPDGSRLLFSEDSLPTAGLMLTDPAGSEPVLVLDDTCEDVTCADIDSVTFSPDGTRIAFLRLVENGSLIATMDLATGSVVELESTRTTDEPSNGAPRWSPDGGRLIFDRQATAPLGGRETNLFVVNADGSDLRRLTPNELFAIDPDWSPDGSSIVFLSSVPSNGEEEPFANDIYTIGSDGTGVRRLTTDGISVRPNWTADGRIVFARVPIDAEGAVTAFELWVMNADGTGQTAARCGRPRRAERCELRDLPLSAHGRRCRDPVPQ